MQVECHDFLTKYLNLSSHIYSFNQPFFVFPHYNYKLLRHTYTIYILMEQQQKFNYGIIGGGVYGLSIAYHLAKSQQTVAIF